MRYFTKSIDTTDGSFLFHFNRIYTVEGTRYHVSVADKRGHSLSFNMHQIDSKWKLVNSSNCPSWILTLEPELSRAIIEHLT
jgi:hypothetical protein